jgi:hypothetical protein
MGDRIPTVPGAGRGLAKGIAAGLLLPAIMAMVAACDTPIAGNPLENVPPSPVSGLGASDHPRVSAGGLDANKYCTTHGFAEADLSDAAQVVCLTSLTTDDLKQACKREDPTTTAFQFRNSTNPFTGTCVVATGTRGISDMRAFCQSRMSGVPQGWKDGLAIRSVEPNPFWQCYTRVDPSAICVSQTGNTAAEADNVDGSWACTKPADGLTRPAVSVHVRVPVDLHA